MDFFLLENSNNYRVQKLRDETGALVLTATLTLEIREVDPETGSSAQVQDGNITWPLSFVHEGKGDYRVHIPPSLPLEIGKQYRAVIEGTANGRTFKETRSLFAKRRLTV